MIESQKLDVAAKILEYVKEKNEEDYELGLQTYCNGREQGYALCDNYNYKVCFSENRNSDEIVVYTGTTRNFSNQGNVPDESKYINATRFDSEEKAAIFIIDFFNECYESEIHSSDENCCNPDDFYLPKRVD